MKAAVLHQFGAIPSYEDFPDPVLEANEVLLQVKAVSLENFDTVGGYRTLENGRVIDASATIQGKSFSGAEGVGRFLRDSPKYPACVTRKLYSYARGVNSEEVEREELAPAYKTFSESGFRLRALLKGMVEMPGFFNASPSEATDAATEVAAK